MTNSLPPHSPLHSVLLKQSTLAGFIPCQNAGFALLTALWTAAILAVLTLGIVSQYQTNTDATRKEILRIKQNELQQSGVRLAALSIASQRRSVSSSGAPITRIQLALEAGSLVIDIENEAARIDLRYVSHELFSTLLNEVGLPQETIGLILREHQSVMQQGRPLTYRLLRNWFGSSPQAYQRLLAYMSLHNGRATVHPQLASSDVLAVLPSFSAADRARLLSERKQREIETAGRSSSGAAGLSQGLFSTPIVHPLLDARLSAFYRVTVTTIVEGQTLVRQEVIKMINAPDKIFESVAQL